MATIRAAPGTGQNTDLSDEDLAALQADLGRLNKVASGLGDRAVRYVAGGTDTSALMEINALWSAPTPPSFLGDDEPDEAYAQHAALRRRALIHMQAWRPAVLHPSPCCSTSCWAPSIRSHTRRAVSCTKQECLRRPTHIGPRRPISVPDQVFAAVGLR